MIEIYLTNNRNEFSNKWILVSLIIKETLAGIHQYYYFHPCLYTQLSLGFNSFGLL